MSTEIFVWAIVSHRIVEYKAVVKATTGFFTSVCTDPSQFQLAYWFKKFRLIHCSIAVSQNILDPMMASQALWVLGQSLDCIEYLVYMCNKNVTGTQINQCILCMWIQIRTNNYIIEHFNPILNCPAGQHLDLLHTIIISTNLG